jgi:hypothetical protein
VPAAGGAAAAQEGQAVSPGPCVLLLTLSARTSAKGRLYLSGWLGKASVVAFPGEPDKHGNPTWDLFVSTPEPRPEQQPQAKSNNLLSSASGDAANRSALPRGDPQERAGWRGLPRAVLAAGERPPAGSCGRRRGL